jgi:SAM-dependent methyltransferase
MPPSTAESYTPGYTDDVIRFMARRRAATHAAFIVPLLAPGMRLLDCGCGPGAITLGLARALRPGEVVGIDREGDQLAAARAEAAREGLAARFVAGSTYALPFADASFAAAFAHALFEHLADPGGAVRELGRVVRPGGFLGVRSPDWGGFLLHPRPPEVERALTAYQDLQRRNGGDVHVGRKLPSLLRAAGFLRVRASASYEVYEDPSLVAELLARRLGRVDDPALPRDAAAQAAGALRAWGQDPDALFAAAWVEAVGWKA